MITLTNVVKRYGTRTIINGVSIAFERGKVTSVLGPSGGGKSTMLRCINGLETFDEGSIKVESDELTADPRGRKRALLSIRRNVGFVFQQWNLFAHRSALANVIEAPIHVKKIPRAEATEQGRALLAKVGMSHREHAYPHELSGGEQQRVAIARALAMQPLALLLDEPTSALDPSLRGEVLRVLAKLADEGVTMILVTHEIAFARDVSHRIVVLHGGNAIEDGPPSDVLDAPKDDRTRSFLGAVK